MSDFQARFGEAKYICCKSQNFICKEANLLLGFVPSQKASPKQASHCVELVRYM